MIRANENVALEWEGAGLPEAPTAPENLKEAGLSLGFLNDLILRTLYTRGGMLGLDLARFLCLPFKVIEEVALLPQGRKMPRGRRRRPDRPRQLSLQPHRARPHARPGRHEAVRLRRPRPGAAGGLRRADLPPGGHRHQLQPEALRAAFAHLVISDELFNAIGPAIVSGKSVFIYGPPGNGKTSIARAIGDFMNNAGGEIYVPYAFLAENSIITVYDQAVHQLAEADANDRLEDNEATIRRLLNTGTVDAALGAHSPAGRHHRRRAEPGHARSALQLRRQLLPGAAARQGQRRRLPDRRLRPPAVQPQGTAQSLDLAAGETATTYLTVASGKKFEVPFEQLIIFSTNLDPKDLVDDAFLRRIRHKVEIEAPDRATSTSGSSTPSPSDWA